MAQIRTSADISALGTILTVWAHPDDESFCSAGIMVAALQNGQKVICVTATKGEAGIQDENRWPANKLSEIRAKEMKDALAILGVKKHFWLDYKDGHCATVDHRKAAKQVRDFITQYEPDSILTFGPDGMTGHRDHQSVSHWVDEAVTELKTKPKVYHVVQLRHLYEKYLKSADKNFDIFFNIEHPPLVEDGDCDICFQMPDDICTQKCAALAAMPSQTERLMNHFGDKAKKAFAYETFVLAP